MLTILEGPDCSGKTTLSQDRMFRLDTVLHQGPYKNNVYIETFDLLYRSWALDKPIVCDRLHLGEQVYGPIFRGHNMLTDTDQDHLESILLKHYRPVVVLCLPSLDVALYAWQDRSAQGKEMLTEQEQFIATYEYYRDKLRTSLPVIRYDYTSDSLDTLAKNIEALRPR